MGQPAIGIISLVIATAFLVWVHEKTSNPAQGLAKVVAWIGIILSVLLLIGQLFMCSKMCMSGHWMHMMRGDMGMMRGMEPPIPPNMPPMRMPEPGK